MFKRFFEVCFILFRSLVICQNKKTWFLHTTETRFIINSGSKQNPEHPFIDCGKEKSCAKFQQKISNSTVIHQNFLEKLPGFLEVIQLCLNLSGGFALNKCYLIPKQLVCKTQFYINHAIHLNGS